jgi:hypothetical protein
MQKKIVAKPTCLPAELQFLFPDDVVLVDLDGVDIKSRDSTSESDQQLRRGNVERISAAVSYFLSAVAPADRPLIRVRMAEELHALNFSPQVEDIITSITSVAMAVLSNDHDLESISPTTRKYFEAIVHITDAHLKQLAELWNVMQENEMLAAQERAKTSVSPTVDFVSKRLGKMLGKHGVALSPDEQRALRGRLGSELERMIEQYTRAVFDNRKMTTKELDALIRSTQEVFSQKLLALISLAAPDFAQHMSKQQIRQLNGMLLKSLKRITRASITAAADPKDENILKTLKHRAGESAHRAAEQMRHLIVGHHHKSGVDTSDYNWKSFTATFARMLSGVADTFREVLVASSGSSEVAVMDGLVPDLDPLDIKEGFDWEPQPSKWTWLDLAQKKVRRGMPPQPRSREISKPLHVTLASSASASLWLSWDTAKKIVQSEGVTFREALRRAVPLRETVEMARSSNVNFAAALKMMYKADKLPVINAFPAAQFEVFSSRLLTWMLAGKIRKQLPEGMDDRTKSLISSFIAGMMKAGGLIPAKRIKVFLQAGKMPDPYAKLKEILCKCDKSTLDFLLKGSSLAFLRTGVGIPLYFLGLGEVPKFVPVGASRAESIVINLLGGGIAGLITSLVVYPTETARVILQTKDPGMQIRVRDVLRQIASLPGREILPRLYAGFLKLHFVYTFGASATMRLLLSIIENHSHKRADSWKGYRLAGVESSSHSVLQRVKGAMSTAWNFGLPDGLVVPATDYLAASSSSSLAVSARVSGFASRVWHAGLSVGPSSSSASSGRSSVLGDRGLLRDARRESELMGDLVECF